jgi:beta-lactam-binding protein with PASTA domain
VADIDGDGMTDIATANRGTNDVSVRRIIAPTPRPGTRLPPDSAVTLLVSRGARR